jgi:predicted nucleic acid-binding protein
MIVVDASIIVHILLDAQIKPEIIDTLENADGLMAPHLIDLEVLSSIRKQLNLKKITQQNAETALNDFMAMTIDRRSTHIFSKRIWDLRNNLTPYDASYVVLAEMTGLQFITRDARLANAPNLQTQVIVL